jgi:acetoin utilization deacetylase AcuC-like enzyme
MKIIFHPDFYSVYTADPAAAKGRIEAVMRAIDGRYPIVAARPASDEDIARAHVESHMESVRKKGLHNIAALAAGGAIQAAEIGRKDSAFALVRPPGHHASAQSSWGFCYYCNMAVALLSLHARGLIQSAFVLDFDLHYGDGNVNILGHRDWVTLHNPKEQNRRAYIQTVAQLLSDRDFDIIGISAGFDHHVDDWGGLLETEDYATMGALARAAADRSGGGCFAVLEGGYNHDVLGKNVAALLEGMAR